MRQCFKVITVAMVLTPMAAADEKPNSKVVFAVHGGAGVIARDKLTAEVERDVRENLKKALDAGFAVLGRGGSSLDAVEAAIVLMEDAPVFNAGRGAAFTREKTVELDASIMEGKSRAAGAVAVVSRIKNPITAARAVMEKSPHVLLTGTGAEKFAMEVGLKMEEPEYFKTPSRLKALEDKVRKEREQRSDDQRAQAASQPANDPRATQPGGEPSVDEHHRYGTVGAVALDKNGNLAAGTSTGGITGKRSGRIGDSPILGAGTYADNKTCAISATGDGEYFIRTSCARTIAALVEYKAMSLEDASRAVLFDQIKPLGGNGGVIVLGPKGALAFSFTTQGMYRGYVTEDGKKKVLIYNDE